MERVRAAVRGFHGGCGWTAGLGGGQGACRLHDQRPGRVLFYVSQAGVSPRPRPLWAPPLRMPWSLSAEAIKWGNSLYPKGWYRSHTSAQLEVWTQERMAVSCLFTWDRTWSPRL